LGSYNIPSKKGEVLKRKTFRQKDKKGRLTSWNCDKGFISQMKREEEGKTRDLKSLFNCRTPKRCTRGARFRKTSCSEKKKRKGRL